MSLPTAKHLSLLTIAANLFISVQGVHYQLRIDRKEYLPTGILILGGSDRNHYPSFHNNSQKMITQLKVAWDLFGPWHWFNANESHVVDSIVYGLR